MKPAESSSNQQQQKDIVAEQQRSNDTPTTSIVSDGNIKEKLTEEKHNDSDSSLSNSTSNASETLTSICNQLASSMNHSSSSTSVEHIDHIDLPHVEGSMQQQNMPDQQADQLTNVASTSTSRSNKGDVLKTFKKCLLCDFVTNRRSVYFKHLPPHFLFKNNPSTEAASGDKSLQDDIDVPGPSKKSKMTKRKKKNCKQCDFVASSKSQYWEHLSTHMTKGYKCVSCKFVTKHNQHMTNHWLTDHDNFKSFECTQCEYVCASKSMLSSHMKSHMSVYPFKCTSCSYKVKFSYLMKKHMNETEHKPIIQNADGTPNSQKTLNTSFKKVRHRSKSCRNKLNQNNNSSTRPAVSQPAALGVATRVNATNQDNMDQDPSVLPLPYSNDRATSSLNLVEQNKVPKPAENIQPNQSISNIHFWSRRSSRPSSNNIINKSDPVLSKRLYGNNNSSTRPAVSQPAAPGVATGVNATNQDNMDQDPSVLPLPYSNDRATSSLNVVEQNKVPKPAENIQPNQSILNIYFWSRRSSRPSSNNIINKSDPVLSKRLYENNNSSTCPAVSQPAALGVATGMNATNQDNMDQDPSVLPFPYSNDRATSSLNLVEQNKVPKPAENIQPNQSISNIHFWSRRSSRPSSNNIIKKPDPVLPERLDETEQPLDLSINSSKKK